jgi:hypothetical protein
MSKTCNQLPHISRRSADQQNSQPVKNDREEVWVATLTGDLLAECFFKAPDETPEELEHMGYPQLLHLYPPEEIRVGQGITPEEMEEIFVEA